MRHDTKRIIDYAIAGSFSAIAAVCVLILIAQLPGWADKKPEWIGALGTIAAFAGTIVIASYETRRRHKDELMRARLRAVSMMSRVMLASQIVKELRSKLYTASQVDKSPAEIIGYGEELKKLDLWSTDEIEPLIPLPNNMAALLAQAGGEIHGALRTFERASLDDTLKPRDTRMSFAFFYCERLGEATAHLDKCIIECVRAREHLHRPELDRIAH